MLVRTLTSLRVGDKTYKPGMVIVLNISATKIDALLGMDFIARVNTPPLAAFPQYAEVAKKLPGMTVEQVIMADVETLRKAIKPADIQAFKDELLALLSHPPKR